MGFKLAKMDVGLTPPIEYMAIKSGETIALGEALVISSAGLTKCGATARPDYVAVGVVTDDGKAPVVKVQDYMLFETTLAAAPGDSATLAEGEKVTLHTDGLQVTSTKTSGVATIVYLEGTAVGSTVRVRF